MEGTSKEARAQLSEGFIGIDAKRFAEMADPELAQWQSNFPIDSAQGILALREWDRRMISHQLHEQFKLDARLAEASEKSNKFTMLCVVAATLVGALIGGFATIAGAIMQQTVLPQGQQAQQATNSLPKGQSSSTKVPTAAASK